MDNYYSRDLENDADDRRKRFAKIERLMQEDERKRVLAEPLAGDTSSQDMGDGSNMSGQSSSASNKSNMGGNRKTIRKTIRKNKRNKSRNKKQRRSRR
jgi:hypothetical protein